MSVHPPSIPRPSRVFTPGLSMPLPPLRGEGEDGPAWTDAPRVKKNLMPLQPIGPLVAALITGMVPIDQPESIAAE